MKQNSILFEIQEKKFDQLLEVIRDHQGEEVFLFVDTDINGDVVILGVDDINNNDIIVFIKENKWIDQEQKLNKRPEKNF